MSRHQEVSVAVWMRFCEELLDELRCCRAQLARKEEKTATATLTEAGCSPTSQAHSAEPQADTTDVEISLHHPYRDVATLGGQIRWHDLRDASLEVRPCNRINDPELGIPGEHDNSPDPYRTISRTPDIETPQARERSSSSCQGSQVQTSTLASRTRSHSVGSCSTCLSGRLRTELHVPPASHSSPPYSTNSPDVRHTDYQVAQSVIADMQSRIQVALQQIAIIKGKALMDGVDATLVYDDLDELEPVLQAALDYPEGIHELLDHDRWRRTDAEVEDEKPDIEMRNESRSDGMGCSVRESSKLVDTDSKHQS